MESLPKIRIAEPKDFSSEVVGKLQNYADVELKNCPPGELKLALNNCDVFWMRLAYKINEKVLDASTRCKVLAIPATGIDHIDEQLCDQLGIKIVCLRGESEFLKEVRATAELTIGLALGVMRNITAASNSVLSGKWDRDSFRGEEIYKKTAGIIGYGRLGAIVAEYFSAMGMKVQAYDIRPSLGAGEDILFTDSLEHLVSTSDLITLHVNYNAENHHLINKKIIDKFKPGSYFVNTSRGGLVDEDALLTALANKAINGAGLDVLWGEPNISNHSLVKYAKNNTNLLIVPHIGGNTYESFEKTEHFIADKIIGLINQWQS